MRVRPLFFGLCLLVGCKEDGVGPAYPEDIKLPSGFKISVYAEVPGARSMTLGSDGTIYVGTREGDAVHAVRDADGDKVGETVVAVASGLDTPNGVAYKDGDLYIAEISRILKISGIDGKLDDAPAPTVVRDDLPTDAHHGWKFIAFGPDGKLYVPVGAPCNVCSREDERYSALLRMNADGSDLEVYASGIRNTVGFTWHPTTKELWFTENGRDKLGDDVPGDEFNHAPEPGMHFGFPYCHQGDTLDPEFGKGRSCDEFIKPAQVLGPHVAALGVRFYTGEMFPEAYRGRAFIAEHGSWNRTDPIGYRVTMVRMQGGKAAGYEVFAEGWLRSDGESWGRPVDVLVMPDGALMVSDDQAGKLYRVTYGG